MRVGICGEGRVGCGGVGDYDMGRNECGHGGDGGSESIGGE